MNREQKSPVSHWSKWKWLYPNLKVKRWFFLASVGIFFFATGFAVMNNGIALGYLELKFREAIYQLTGNVPSNAIPAGILISACGILLTVMGFRRGLRSIISILLPDEEIKIVDTVYSRQSLRRGPHIVVIGGGTGLSALLRGLKDFTSNLTAIVTVADDGGSSGTLRNEMGVLPPGDIRNCLVALADKEDIMEDLFSYRFEAGTLAGHSLGNLLLAGMADVCGDFQVGVDRISKIFALRGNVYPSTLEQVTLSARLANGKFVTGETNVRCTEGRIVRVSLTPEDCRPLPEALAALRQADLIVLGPGSLYTSVLPNLLVQGLCEQIRTAEAPCVYVCNIMTEPGETDGYQAVDHVRELLSHCGSGVLDAVLLNSQEISGRLLDRYVQEGSQPVDSTTAEIERFGIKCFTDDLVSDGAVVRHDSRRLAKALIRILFRMKPIGEKLALLDTYILAYKSRQER
ncbi:MAG: YvcK family protein [Peptococcaceae bacterium]|nr:YvcK family protein [Peptococcaceae bacterium]